MKFLLYLLPAIVGVASMRTPNALAQAGASQQSENVASTQNSNLKIAQLSRSDSQEVSLVVLRARALTAFDEKVPFRPSHRADFRVTSAIADVAKASVTIQNQDKPRFNHIISKRIQPGMRVPMSLQLEDRDGEWASNLADISPAHGRHLHLEYDSATGKIFGPMGNMLGHHGEVITVRGNAEQHRASITFIVK